MSTTSTAHAWQNHTQCLCAGIVRLSARHFFQGRDERRWSQGNLSSLILLICHWQNCRTLAGSSGLHRSCQLPVARTMYLIIISCSSSASAPVVKPPFALSESLSFSPPTFTTILSLSFNRMTSKNDDDVVRVQLHSSDVHKVAGPRSSRPLPSPPLRSLPSSSPLSPSLFSPLLASLSLFPPVLSSFPRPPHSIPFPPWSLQLPPPLSCSLVSVHWSLTRQDQGRHASRDDVYGVNQWEFRNVRVPYSSVIIAVATPVPHPSHTRPLAPPTPSSPFIPTFYTCRLLTSRDLQFCRLARTLAAAYRGGSKSRLASDCKQPVTQKMLSVSLLLLLSVLCHPLRGCEATRSALLFFYIAFISMLTYSLADYLMSIVYSV